MSNWEWALYGAMALLYGWAFNYSLQASANTKAARVTGVIMSVVAGAGWIVAVPLFAFVVLIMSGMRERA